MKLTDEQKDIFKGHAMTMVMHISGEDEHILTHRCTALKLTRSTATPVIPYDKKTDSRFGAPVVTYFLDDDKQKYKTLAEVANAIIASRGKLELQG